MVQIIEATTVNELFRKTSKAILDAPESSPRGLKTREIRDAWLILHDPSNPICTLDARGLNLDYLNGELEWYLSGSLNVQDIQKHSSFWGKLADSNGTVNSNYGFLALKEKWSGMSQLEWCVKQLQQDPETRQAVINYNQPRHKYNGNKDFVCTMYQQFRADGNALDTTVSMRSNDLIFGLSYDLPWFVYLQKQVADQIVLNLGKYQHHAGSLHAYERHYPMLEKMAYNGDILWN